MEIDRIYRIDVSDRYHKYTLRFSVCLYIRSLTNLPFCGILINRDKINKLGSVRVLSNIVDEPKWVLFIVDIIVSKAFRRSLRGGITRVLAGRGRRSILRGDSLRFV